MNKGKERKNTELKNKLKIEERYYNPPFLNKWFAISSALFFLSMVALFYDDFNDSCFYIRCTISIQFNFF